LIIALFALAAGPHEVVKASIVGSMLGQHPAVVGNAAEQWVFQRVEPRGLEPPNPLLAKVTAWPH
jgi:hypothetical protein